MDGDCTGLFHQAEWGDWSSADGARTVCYRQCSETNKFQQSRTRVDDNVFSSRAQGEYQTVGQVFHGECSL